MSIPDDRMYDYYELCTDMKSRDVALLRQSLLEGKKHPREAKIELAKLIIRDFHSGQEADQAEEEFNRVFQQKLQPEEIEERRLSASVEKIRLTKLIAQLGLANSVSEANRLIEQDAVMLNDQKVSNVKAELDLSQEATYVLKVGKRRFLRLVIGVAS